MKRKRMGSLVGATLALSLVLTGCQGVKLSLIHIYSYVYFVHSYYLKAEEPEIVKASAWYGTDIHASVEKGNIFACQFHPEKSSDVGLHILKNFAELGKEEG